MNNTNNNRNPVFIEDSTSSRTLLNNVPKTLSEYAQHFEALGKAVGGWGQSEASIIQKCFAQGNTEVLEQLRHDAFNRAAPEAQMQYGDYLKSLYRAGDQPETPYAPQQSPSYNLAQLVRQNAVAQEHAAQLAILLSMPDYPNHPQESNPVTVGVVAQGSTEASVAHDGVVGPNQ